MNFIQVLRPHMMRPSQVHYRLRSRLVHARVKIDGSTAYLAQRTLTPIAASLSSAAGGTASGLTVHPPQSKQEFNASFLGDYQLAFGDQSTWQLLCALVVLRACSVDAFVDRCQKLLELGLRALGPSLLARVISPFYNQFVVGHCEEELEVKTRKLTDKGIHLLLCPGFETDLGSFIQQEQNTRVMLDFLELSSRYASPGVTPTCHVRVSGLISADQLATISQWYETLSPEERLQALHTLGTAMEVTKGHPHSAPHLNLPGLKKDDLLLLRNFLPRWYQIGSRAERYGIVLLVDAEYTYINPAINFLSLALMHLFNRASPIVWNTYQAYLKNAMPALVDDLKLADQLPTTFGVKLVRGAYMERERRRAHELGYPDPVNDTYEDTCNNYNNIANFMLEEASKHPLRRRLMIATNNEESVRLATQRMGQLGLQPRSGTVIFGQVYGMAENVSVALAKSGFLTYKSAAYGPLEEVLPYLARRAAENRTVAKGSRRERQLIQAELRRRLRWATQ